MAYDLVAEVFVNHKLLECGKPHMSDLRLRIAVMARNGSIGTISGDSIELETRIKRHSLIFFISF